jgi:phosphoglycerol transferase MdoB-like AlkP superfamily enzyme
MTRSRGSDPILVNQLLFSPVLLLFCSQTVALQSPGDALLWMLQHPAAVGATWVLLLTGLLVVFALLRRIWPAVLLTGLPVMGLSLVSYYKTLFNGVPLTLSDLAMAKDLLEIAAYTGGSLEVSWQTLLAIACSLLWLAGAVYLEHFHGRRHARTTGEGPNPHAAPQEHPRMRRLLSSVGLPLATALLLLMLVMYPLRASAAISGQELPTQGERNDVYGYVWGLYVAFSSNDATLPVDISAEQVASMEAVLKQEKEPASEPASEARETEASSEPTDAPAAPEPSVRPSIVFLMSESFFDITQLPNVTFSEDPLPNFRRLSAESTDGGFHSNTYSGGTGNVEMEMFTGISSVLLKESETLTSLSSNELYQELPSMVKLLRSAGYRTTAIHSHNNRLFNRSISFPAIGFEQVLFSDSFPADVEMKGGYISDMALAKEMIRLYEARSQEEPYFLYALSMENHQPYTADKFSEPLQIGIESPVLSQEDLGILSSLVQGLMDADRSLGYLLDYFDAQDEPVILVFCGDHLPGMYLSKADTVYTKTGYASTVKTLDWAPDELKKMLTTNYAVWTNTDIPLWPDRDESCMSLGLSILKLADIPLSGFFKWLDENLMGNMLLHRPRLFVDADGTASSTPPEAYREALENYRILVHQILYAPTPP